MPNPFRGPFYHQTTTVVLRAMVVTYFAILVTSALTACGRGANRPNPATGSGPSATTPVPVASTVATGGGSGDAGGGSNDRPTYDEIRASLQRLRDDTFWIGHSLGEIEYKNSRGELHKDLTFGRNATPALKKLLMKIDEDKMEWDPYPGHLKWKFRLVEQGPCESVDGKREASAKVCDQTEPICLSLEYIQKLTPKASLDASLRALIMHEVAHQHCADESLAKQVERFYSQESLQQQLLMRSISATFDEIHGRITMLHWSLKTGLNPDTAFLDKKLPLSDTQLCRDIGAAEGTIETLRWQIKSMVQGEDIVDAGTPLGDLRNMILDWPDFCGNDGRPNTHALEKGDRAALFQKVALAPKAFDVLAEQISKVFGMYIWDFSEHLFPYPGPFDLPVPEAKPPGQ
jgi:hypothetical protein